MKTSMLKALKATFAICCWFKALILSADAFVIPRQSRFSQHIQHYEIDFSKFQSKGRDADTESMTLRSDNNEDTSVSDKANVEGRWKGGGRVSVEVTKHVFFPAGSILDGDDPLRAASNSVREAWLEYHWKKGGGLPILILQQDEHRTNKSDGSEGKQRIIAPVLMEERISSFPLQLTEPEGPSAASLNLEYKVTSPGPFFGNELVTGSHLGSVIFSSDYSSDNRKSDQRDEEVMTSEAKNIITTMTWKVEFETIQLLELYQKVTEFTIGTASQTVVEAIQTPRLLSLQTHISPSKETSANDDEGALGPAVKARREWLDLLFSSQGGGLPLPPPLSFGEILQEGGGLARQKLLRFPPGLVETAIVDSPSTVAPEDVGSEKVTAYYQLENPGWLTFPFLVHTHLGRVTFRPLSLSSLQNESKQDRQKIEEPPTYEERQGIEMIWEVEIRPYRFVRPLVEKLTEMTISTIARNVKVRLEEPGARVVIKPPRGGTGRQTQTFGSVSKATWVGRVLDAHLIDARSTWEQTVSLFQPWTWGEEGNGDNIEFVWSDRRMTKP
mmetsp:Transcript_3757/g.10672  ORF Transcript_3757/g.10672 Transcript_3757/m.10672 type:complete len:556 (-) Transcript_3757:1012-2679(-)